MGLLAGDELGNGHVSRFHEGLEEDEEEDSEEPLSEVVVRGDAEVNLKAPLTREDKKAMALLIVLCTFSIQAFTAFFLLISRNGALSLAYPSHFVRYNPRSSCEFFYTVLAQGNARALEALHLMTSFIMYYSSA
jgi:hypothetical protein